MAGPSTLSLSLSLYGPSPSPVPPLLRTAERIPLAAAVIKRGDGSSDAVTSKQQSITPIWREVAIPHPHPHPSRARAIRMAAQGPPVEVDGLWDALSSVVLTGARHRSVVAASLRARDAGLLLELATRTCRWRERERERERGCSISPTAVRSAGWLMRRTSSSFSRASSSRRFETALPAPRPSTSSTRRR